jgi:hypothetical protein
MPHGQDGSVERAGSRAGGLKARGTLRELPKPINLPLEAPTHLYAESERIFEAEPGVKIA